MNRPSLVVAFVLVATTVMVSPTAPPIAVHAQSATDFVPAHRRDASGSGSGRLADVAPHARRLGL